MRDYNYISISVITVVRNLSFYVKTGVSMLTIHSESHKPPAPEGGDEKMVNAARLAESILSGFSPLVDSLRNKYLTYRLEQTLINGLINVPRQVHPISPVFFLASFQFNEHYPLHKRLNTEFYIDWGSGHKIIVYMPAITPLKQLTPAGRTRSANLKIAALNIVVENATITGKHLTEIIIPYDDIILPAQKIILPVASHPHSISIVATGLEYITSHNNKLSTLINKKWQPVDILDAVYFLN